MFTFLLILECKYQNNILAKSMKQKPSKDVLNHKIKNALKIPTSQAF